MYIRRTTIKSRQTGNPTTPIRLVESIREGGQVRQRTLLNLGRHLRGPASAVGRSGAAHRAPGWWATGFDARVSGFALGRGGETLCGAADPLAAEPQRTGRVDRLRLRGHEAQGAVSHLRSVAQAQGSWRGSCALKSAPCSTWSSNPSLGCGPSSIARPIG